MIAGVNLPMLIKLASVRTRPSRCEAVRTPRRPAASTSTSPRASWPRKPRDVMTRGRGIGALAAHAHHRQPARPACPGRRQVRAHRRPVRCRRRASPSRARRGLRPLDHGPDDAGRRHRHRGRAALLRPPGRGRPGRPGRPGRARLRRGANSRRTRGIKPGLHMRQVCRRRRGCGRSGARTISAARSSPQRAMISRSAGHGPGLRGQGYRARRLGPQGNRHGRDRDARPDGDPRGIRPEASRSRARASPARCT